MSTAAGRATQYTNEKYRDRSTFCAEDLRGAWMAGWHDGSQRPNWPRIAWRVFCVIVREFDK